MSSAAATDTAPGAATVTKLEARPVDAYECLRSAIVRGQLQPNERLIEADVSDRFSLRPAAVRKALIQLQHEGLVEHERFRGARVHRFTESEVEEILEASAALKSVAIRLATRRVTPQQLELLRSTLTQLSESYARGHLLEAAERTHVLHHQLLEVSGQRVIQRMCSSLSAQMAHFQYQSVLLPGGSEESLRLQAQIVEAVSLGDEDAAESAIREHFAHMIRILRENAGGFAYGTVP